MRWRNAISPIGFFLCDAAQCLVTGVHADVGWLVEAAENADLGKLGHPGKQHKLQVAVCSLEQRIKSLQYLSVPVFEHTFLPGDNLLYVGVKNIEYRFVIFVYEHNTTPAAALMRPLQNVGETGTQALGFNLSPIFLFP